MKKVKNIPLAILLLVVAGCAVLPDKVSLSRQEKSEASVLFKRLASQQAFCPNAIDADVSVTLKKMLGAGTITGYAQAMDPSFIRFEGVNPLGMTEMVVATDGHSFTLLNVRQKRGYHGAVQSKGLDEYSLGDFAESAGFYWLIGRMPPGRLSVAGFDKDQDGKGYWADISYKDRSKRSLILFSAQDGLIHQNIALDSSGEVIVRFSYEYGAVSSEPASSTVEDTVTCRLPEQVTIDGNGNGTLIINLKKIYPDAEVSRSDFDIEIPKGFEKEIIR